MIHYSEFLDGDLKYQIVLRVRTESYSSNVTLEVNFLYKEKRKKLWNPIKSNVSNRELYGLSIAKISEIETKAILDKYPFLIPHYNKALEELVLKFKNEVNIFKI